MSFSITGLTSYTQKVAHRLAAAPGEAELRELHKSIAMSARRVEIALDLKSVGEAQLTAKSREYRGWIRFFADYEDLAGYVDAVRSAMPIFESALAQQSRFKPPVQVYFLPLRGLYRMRQPRTPRGAGPLEVILPTPAVTFTLEDFTAVAQCALLGHTPAKRRVLEGMKSEPFAGVAAELESLGGLVDESKGEHHDLAESYARVAARYFPGGVARPKLFWSRSLTHRKFGHYDWVNDAIMLSRTLDAAEVPEFLVDFVMYHELLHKAHGLRWSGGRRYAHTAAFYADEKKFERYDDAEETLKKLAKATRAARG